METKTDIRKRILKKRTELSTDEVKEKSDIICRHIAQNQAFLAADIIYGYMPIRKEADILPVLRLALRMGKTVGLPRVAGDDMDFYRICDFSELETGSFSVMEPAEHCPILKETGMMLIPMTAFDTDGNRLGYGKGFYDRYIRKSRENYKSNNSLFGVAYEFQKTPAIPGEETDCPMDYIITEKSIIKGGK